MNAIVQGMKARLILNRHPNLRIIKKEIDQVLDQGGKSMIIDVNDKRTLRNMMKRRRQKILEFIRVFNKAYV